ncbi:energy-coupling factor transporter ATPase [Terribacillus sp. 179-K 1B1 HS]|uniref:ABC transporter ATP-binding protein n=1 Tax=Terribacillus sp. 179-K 1B1 HS TaxID=3142388 RepID=UPI00399FB327
MKQPLLEVNQLTVTFEEESIPTLTDLSFTIQQGDSILLLGPSGSGKSTLTYCLNGLYPKELDGKMSGSISFTGSKIEDFKSGEINLEVATVFQDPETQFCMLTVEDEIAFGLENRKLAPEKMDSEIDRVLSLVGLQNRRKDQIHTLSGGQKQKVALAAVLALEPRLLILDEPTANLDPAASKDLVETIHHLKKQQDITLLIIEHNIDYWLPIINRTMLLDRDGSLFFDGDLRDAINLYDEDLQQRGIWLPEAVLLAKQAQLPKPWPLTIDLLPDGLQFQTVTPEVMQTEKCIVRVENAIFHNKEKVLLDIPNLTIWQGEFLAITGKNGSGKTLLSRLMTGLLKPTGGGIEFLGNKLSRWKTDELYQQIGYVFQNPEHQFLTDSVWGELAYSQTAYEGEIQKALEEIQLAAQADKHPFTLSQGQKRRLSVSTMLVQEPQLLVLDEPTFGQDSHTTDVLMNLIRKHHQRGCTIVMITHDMELVDRFATRVLIVDKGSIVHDDKPAAIWARTDLPDHGLSLPAREVYLKRKQEASLYA